MIDPADKETQSPPLEQPKRKRGRPSTGKAMTPAEKQKAYRERINDQLIKAIERAELAEAKLRKALATIEKMKKSNVAINQE
jgi:hypothetical protein